MDKMNRTMWVIGGAVAVVIIGIVVAVVIGTVGKNGDKKPAQTTAAVTTAEVTTEEQKTEKQTEQQTEAPTTTVEATTEKETTEEATTQEAALVVLYANDFEDGTFGTFAARGGGEAIEIIEGGSDTYCLHVKGRTKSWGGAKVDVSNVANVPGYAYYLAADAKFSGDADSANLMLSFQYTDTEGTERYGNIATASATNDEWVSLGSWFNLPEDAAGTGICIYIESNNETVDLYLDNVTLAAEQ